MRLQVDQLVRPTRSTARPSRLHVRVLPDSAAILHTDAPAPTSAAEPQRAATSAGSPLPLHLQIGAGLWSQLISLGGWEPSSPAPIDLERSQLCGVVVCAGPMLLDLHNDLLFQVLAFLIPCDLVGIFAFASACGRTC